MKKRRLLYGAAVMAAVFVSCPLVWGQDSDASGVMKKGVVHNIASDRKVERVGGIYEPEGLDKYMKRKFDEMMGKLSEMEAQMDRLNSEMSELKKTMSIKQKSTTLVG